MQRMVDLTKLPNLQHMKYVAHVKVHPQAGKALPHHGDPVHVSFWMYASFHAHSAVVKLEPLP